MSQQGFVGGFLAGAALGGAIGGVLGVVIASRLSQAEANDTEAAFSKLDKATRKKALKPPTEQSIETARRGLEDKIAQLNDAIDDVRQQLGGVNGSYAEALSDRPITPEA